MLAPVAVLFSSLLCGFSAGLATGVGIAVVSAGAGGVGLTSDAGFSASVDFVSDGAGEEHAETNKNERRSEKYNR